MRALLLTWILLVPMVCLAAEADYQRVWCEAASGQMEVILPDRTRIDCETADEVVEFDFDYKWAEGLGQALHYSRMTGKRGRVVLIGDKNADKIRSLAIMYCLPISVEVMPR